MRGTKIYEVTRKPRTCPYCKSQPTDDTGHIVPIIYGTGDYTEIDYLFEYHKTGMMGGDTIPRNPPKWGCNICGRRFRLVDEQGNYVPWKVHLLKNERHNGKEKIFITSNGETIEV